MKYFNTKQQQKIEKLAKQYHIQLLYLFGSQSRGDIHPESDIDIGYIRTNNSTLSLHEQLSFMSEVQDLFNNPDAAVDVVNIHTAPPLLSFLIVTTGQKLYGKEINAQQLYIKTVKNYIDSKPLFNATEEYVKHKLTQFR